MSGIEREYAAVSIARVVDESDGAFWFEWKTECGRTIGAANLVEGLFEVRVLGGGEDRYYRGGHGSEAELVYRDAVKLYELALTQRDERGAGGAS